MKGAAFKFSELSQQRERQGELYYEFLRVPDLSTGLYVLEAGAKDPQQPHSEDEVYIVMKGKAKINVAHEIYSVSSGSVVYVKANVEHRFFDIAERLEVLVFFAPAEYTKKPEEKRIT